MCCFSMGCISSKRDTCANVFQVVNVDEFGNQLKSGQLEVTENQLVLYQQGKPPVRWPLKTLRRYGFDSDHFSFESGRRSPTGPGVYSFLCRRAEQLVSLLETRLQIRVNAENDSEGNRRISHRLSSISSGGPLSPLGSTTPLIENMPVVPIARPVSHNLYANEDIIASAFLPPPVTAAASSDPQDETNNNKIGDGAAEHTYTNMLLGGADVDDPPSPGHLYMNIVPGTDNIIQNYQTQPQPLQFVDWEPEEPLHNYANLDLESELEGLSRPASLSLSKPILNYIVLDLEPGSEQPPPRSPTTSLPPDSPRKLPPGYATIDFDKTAALSHSVDPSFDDSECLRKTRHNSHISQLPRHSSSISD